jgi:hypothetical protein
MEPRDTRNETRPKRSAVVSKSGGDSHVAVFEKSLDGNYSGGVIGFSITQLSSMLE